MSKTLAKFKEIVDFKGKHVSMEELHILLEVLVQGMQEHKDELENLSSTQQKEIFDEVKNYMHMVEEHFNNASGQISVVVDANRAEVAKHLDDIKAFWETIQNKVPKDGEPGKPGKDADEEAVVQKVLARMPVISPFVLDGGDIVEKINNLPTDNDDFKIDWSHIKNAPKYKETKPFIYPLRVDNGGTPGGGTVTSIATSGSVTGGTITDTGTISLVNDNATPGNSQYYGTDSSGTKGFFALPTVSAVVTDGESILGDGSIGDPITAQVQMSVTFDASGLKLSGDVTSPGNSKYYGTDGSGTRGWYSSVNGTVTSVALNGGATGLTVSGSPITTSGVMQLGGILNRGNGGTGTNMGTDPIFNRLWGWDVTDGKIVYMTLGNGISYNHSTHTIDTFVPLDQVGGALAQGAPQDSFNNHIDWQWNSLGNNYGLKLSVNGVQALTGQNVFWASLDGVNATASVTSIAGRFTNTHTGTNAINIAAQFTASGGSTNTAIDVTNGNINQAGGNFLTSGVITINNSTTITGGGVSIRLPTTNSGTAGWFVQTDGLGNWEYAAVSAGASPGGSTNDIQTNNGSGGFNGSASNFQYDPGTSTLSLFNGQAAFSNTTTQNALIVTSDAQNALTVLGNAGGSAEGLDIAGGNANNEAGIFEKLTDTTIASYTPKDNTGGSDRVFIYANRKLMYGLDTDIWTVIGANINLTPTANINFGSLGSRYDVTTETMELGSSGVSASHLIINTSSGNGEPFKIFDFGNSSNIMDVDTGTTLILMDQDDIGYSFGFKTDSPKSPFEIYCAPGYAWAPISTNLSLDGSTMGWSYNGTGGDTFTLPDIATTRGRHYVVMNRGSGSALTVNCTGGDEIYESTNLSTVSISAGTCYTFDNDGTYWVVSAKR